MAAAVVLLLMGLLVGSTWTAHAADIVSDEVYRLDADAVVSDDLYVFAREVYIDGKVEGDLVVAAGYVEINGIVTGDVMGAAGGIVINGVVGDDARLAGSGIVITGNVADDLFAAGGGDGFSQWAGAASVGRAVVPGVRILADAVVTSDAYLAGGTGLIEGAIGRNLTAAFGTLEFGGRVDGDAELTARTLSVNDGASVGGTLTYRTPESTVVPQNTAADVVMAPWDVRTTPAAAEPNRLETSLWWLLRTVMLALGLAVVGWLWLRFWPRALARPASVMVRRPVESALWGLLLLVLAVPLSAGLILLAVLFWNWFPGGAAMLALTFGAWTWLWLLSPLFVGYALSIWLHARDVIDWDARWTALALAALIAIVARILGLVPFVGAVSAGLVYVITLAFTVGALALLSRAAVIDNGVAHDGAPARGTEPDQATALPD
ncbi:MAG: hypothetical protein H6644_16335 [Caldilineaceae bacterium]|nr:hypothetical protein [Caldilineaceae bacterium]